MVRLHGMLTNQASPACTMCAQEAPTQHMNMLSTACSLLCEHDTIAKAGLGNAIRMVHHTPLGAARPLTLVEWPHPQPCRPRSLAGATHPPDSPTAYFAARPPASTHQHYAVRLLRARRRGNNSSLTGKAACPPLVKYSPVIGLISTHGCMSASCLYRA